MGCWRSLPGSYFSFPMDSSHGELMPRALVFAPTSWVGSILRSFQTCEFGATNITANCCFMVFFNVFDLIFAWNPRKFNTVVNSPADTARLDVIYL